ncbi:hypothetical protein [Oceanobacillus luteolus]|uniref:Lipoprotein n=1 Tax=Oceanobacillus luteolus TaxID=1274358 RepID=A0ABW4HT68_9BACI
MKNKKRLVVVLGVSALLLFGCSSAGKNEVVIIDEETGEEIVVQQEELDAKEKEIQDYSQHLSETFTASMSLQDTFAHALDDMFTKESSASQFAKILRDQVINESRDVLDKGEKYNFPGDYFELNQMVVTNLNNQHQLFLDAVNEATTASQTEDREVDIVKLREQLANLKQEYLTIVNTWKNGGNAQH